MKPYYHAHESAYQKIKSKGFVGWGDARTLADLGDEETISYLKQVISAYLPNPSGKRALDVGCGSGTTAFTLADMDLDVTGVDISMTAIEMAKDLATQQNLKIEFLVADILELEKLNKKFDLIYDSHCLHCIVFEEDRRKVFQGIKSSLADSGIFILDTMVMPERPYDPASDFDTLRFDEDFILWHKTKPTAGYGIIEKDGQYWCAQRRIYPEEKVIAEITEAGFEIVRQQTDAQKHGDPAMLRLVLK